MSSPVESTESSRQITPTLAGFEEHLQRSALASASSRRLARTINQVVDKLNPQLAIHHNQLRHQNPELLDTMAKKLSFMLTYEALGDMIDILTTAKSMTNIRNSCMEKKQDDPDGLGVESSVRGGYEIPANQPT